MDTHQKHTFLVDISPLKKFTPGKSHRQAGKGQTDGKLEIGSQKSTAGKTYNLQLSSGGLTNK